jgi:hypothetical protein
MGVPPADRRGLETAFAPQDRTGGLPIAPAESSCRYTSEAHHHGWCMARDMGPADTPETPPAVFTPVC